MYFVVSDHALGDIDGLGQGLLGMTGGLAEAGKALAEGFPF